MDEIKKCLCGADPIIEKKTTDNIAVPEVYKYRCPNCEEKELPFIGQWHESGASEAWNRIAQKSRYKKRPFEYNIHGVCISPPFQVLQWENKKKSAALFPHNGRPIEHITVNFFYGNSRYFYCFDYNYKHNGGGFWLSINDPCFISLEMAKKSAMKALIKRNKDLKKIVEKLFSPVQGELFT